MGLPDAYAKLRYFLLSSLSLEFSSPGSSHLPVSAYHAQVCMFTSLLPAALF